MGNIKTAGTIYDGYQFESRLQARWAVFFNKLGVQWEYKPECFVLPDRKIFEPDFRLPGYIGRVNGKMQDLWARVIPISTRTEYDDHTEFKKEMEMFCDNLRNPVIALPNIPENITEWVSCYITNFEFVDGDYFGCGISKDNKWSSVVTLCGADYNDITKENESLTNAALYETKRYRF